MRPEPERGQNRLPPALASSSLELRASSFELRCEFRANRRPIGGQLRPARRHMAAPKRRARLAFQAAAGAALCGGARGARPQVSRPRARPDSAEPALSLADSRGQPWTALDSRQQPAGNNKCKLAVPSDKSRPCLRLLRRLLLYCPARFGPQKAPPPPPTWAALVWRRNWQILIELRPGDRRKRAAALTASLFAPAWDLAATN